MIMIQLLTGPNYHIYNHMAVDHRSHYDLAYLRGHVTSLTHHNCLLDYFIS